MLVNKLESAVRSKKGIIKSINRNKIESLLADSDQRSEKINNTDRWQLTADNWKLNTSKLLNSYSLLLNSVLSQFEVQSSMCEVGLFNLSW